MSYLTQHPHTSSRLQNEKAKNLGEKWEKISKSLHLIELLLNINAALNHYTLNI